MRPLLPLFFLSACITNGFIPKDLPSEAVDPGTIRGQVCSGDGRSWLADASVYTNVLDDEGRLLETKVVYTDLDGNFELEGLPGDMTYTVYVQYGGDILAQFDDIELPAGETVVLPEPDCFDPLDVDVAVITGNYDDFQLVLGNMGFANYDVFDGLDATELLGLLLNPEQLSRYDIVFVDGGCLEEGIFYGGDAVSDNIIANLRDYVAAGGSIYASDWAYDAVEIAWPDAIEFVGEDSEPDAAQLGEYDEVSASVSDASLAEWLGETRIDIAYDLPVWPAIQSVSDAVSVHLAGTVSIREGETTWSLPAVPMLVSFNSGEGKVVFSTFRVAKNANTDMLLVLQYMMYNL